MHLREQWKHTERTEEHIKRHGAFQEKYVLCYAAIKWDYDRWLKMQEGISTCII